MTNERIPLAGVIGSPIAHSKSPRLHAHWLRKLGIRGHYIPMDVSADNLREALITLPKIGFVGVNVTIPHKRRALELADTVTDRATLIGAANTLIFRRDGRIQADNTDGYGFLQNLVEQAPDWTPQDGEAVVLGAGGAARAVVAALLDAGVSRIKVTNRTRIRAEQLQQDFGNRVKVVEWVNAGNALEDAALVVNSTALGMQGKPELKVPLDGLQPGAVAYDLVYAPLQTRFLQSAAEQGCKTVDGLGMLIHQAVPAFERFFGARPQVDDSARKVLAP